MALRRKEREVPFRKIIPNMITCGNVLCGMLSVVLSFHEHYALAGWLILAAVFFDFMDGKVARSLGGSSAFGMELDSLADVVSFGVAPAMVVYGAALRGFLGVTGALAAAFFALCGALRLARFNVTHAPAGSFQGLPIPAGGLFLVSFVMGGVTLPPAIFAAVVVGTGVLMVSNIPYGNLKKLRKGNMNRGKGLFLSLFLLGLGAIFREKAPLMAMGIYVVSGCFRFDWGGWLSKKEGECPAPGEKP